jgi:hypothetical protein
VIFYLPFSKQLADALRNRHPSMRNTMTLFVPAYKIYLLLIACCLLSIAASAQTDTIPSCLLDKTKGDSMLQVKQYYYKGQLWYSLANKKPVTQSDMIYHIKLMTANCKPVGEWTRGGIAGLNKIIPDTIDTKKIWLKQSHSFFIPDTLGVAASRHSAYKIDAYTYKGEPLYKMISYTTPEQKKQMIIREYYYNYNGKLILVYKRATEGSFMRAQGWETTGVDPAQLKKLSYSWQRIGTTYQYHQP